MSIREQFLAEIYALLLKEAIKKEEAGAPSADYMGHQRGYKLSDDPVELAEQARRHATALFGPEAQ